MPVDLPFFPSDADYGGAFWREALRHLGDAHALHSAGRHAGAITSSMKAAELGTKAVLILDGAMGWWDKLLTSHRPVTDIEGQRPVLRRHFDEINNADPTLIATLKVMERLAPVSQSRGNYDLNEVANPEYPFFASVPTPDGGLAPALHEPGSFFDEPRSRRFYEAARELIVLLPTLYPAVTGGGPPDPPPAL